MFMKNTERYIKVKSMAQKLINKQNKASYILFQIVWVELILFRFIPMEQKKKKKEKAF